MLTIHGTHMKTCIFGDVNSFDVHMHVSRCALLFVDTAVYCPSPIFKCQHRGSAHIKKLAVVSETTFPAMICFNPMRC